MPEKLLRSCRGLDQEVLALPALGCGRKRARLRDATAPRVRMYFGCALVVLSKKVRAITITLNQKGKIVLDLSQNLWLQ